MFDGYGVGLTISPLGVDGGPLSPGERPSRLTEVLPVEAWPAEQKAQELGRIARFRSMLDAHEASLVVAFAGDRR